MCELFGFSGKALSSINEELKAFFSHAASNPDGWGLYLKSESGSVLYKEAVRADRSSKLSSFLKDKVEATDAVAHIRLATIGYDDLKNTHPFTGRDLSGREWVLAHNGTVFEGDLISGYFYEQEGDTDSERILLYLMDLINKEITGSGGPLSFEQRFDVIEKMAVDLSPDNKLNLLIYDGEVLYAHSNYPGSLYYSDTPGGIMICTAPEDKKGWGPVPYGRLNAFLKGKLIRTGERESAEYVPDEKNLNALYLVYSGL